MLPQSGLLLFGRNPEKASRISQQIRKRQVQKEYVCRVDGRFPEENIECFEPIEVVSHKLGVCQVSPRGKDCSTVFKRLGYNEKTNTSVVLCKPKTGRMHQIRVHLQYFGYPVVNDRLYNHPVFGPLRGKGGDIGGRTVEQLVTELLEIHNSENWVQVDAAQGDTLLSEPMFKDGARSDAFYDPHCYQCRVRYREPRPRDLVMYLHAWKYKASGWEYETELPPWAHTDWEETNNLP